MSSKSNRATKRHSAWLERIRYSFWACELHPGQPWPGLKRKGEETQQQVAMMAAAPVKLYESTPPPKSRPAMVRPILTCPA